MARRGREALLEGWESLGGPSGGLVGVGKGWEALDAFPEGWECGEGVEGPSGGPGGVERLFQRDRRIREGQQMSVGPSGWTGGIGEPSRWVGKGSEALPNGWKSSGGPSGGTRVVGSGWEAHSGVCEWSGGPSGGLGVVGRHSQKTGRDQEERKGLGVPREGWEDWEAFWESRAG